MDKIVRNVALIVLPVNVATTMATSAILDDWGGFIIFAGGAATIISLLFVLGLSAIDTRKWYSVRLSLIILILPIFVIIGLGLFDRSRAVESAPDFYFRYYLGGPIPASVKNIVLDHEYTEVGNGAVIEFDISWNDLTNLTTRDGFEVDRNGIDIIEYLKDLGQGYKLRLKVVRADSHCILEFYCPHRQPGKHVQDPHEQFGLFSQPQTKSKGDEIKRDANLF